MSWIPTPGRARDTKIVGPDVLLSSRKSSIHSRLDKHSGFSGVADGSDHGVAFREAHGDSTWAGGNLHYFVRCIYNVVDACKEDRGVWSDCRVSDRVSVGLTWLIVKQVCCCAGCLYQRQQLKCGDGGQLTLFYHGDGFFNPPSHSLPECEKVCRRTSRHCCPILIMRDILFIHEAGVGLLMIRSCASVTRKAES